MLRLARSALLVLLFFSLGACTNLASRLADSLSAAIQNQDDPETVKDGAPAYLLMIDALIEGDPENSDLLFTGAKLYGAYAAAFVDDAKRQRRLSDKAHRYAKRALCEEDLELCAAVGQPFDLYQQALLQLDDDDAGLLYNYTAAWAAWLQARTDDWNAIAELPKIRAGMERVLILDEGHDQGGAHLYMGVLETLLPPSLGGKPEVGRKHFQRAIELSAGKNLMASVLYARHYARLVFNRELHDELLQQVLATDPQVPQLTLINTLAQAQAKQLLASAEEYF